MTQGTTLIDHGVVFFMTSVLMILCPAIRDAAIESLGYLTVGRGVSVNVIYKDPRKKDTQQERELFLPRNLLLPSSGDHGLCHELCFLSSCFLLLQQAPWPKATQVERGLF